MSGRRRFGSVRRLPSGRFQARFPDPDTGRLRPAPHTFTTKGAASQWLSTVEADVLRNVWQDVTLGEVTFGEVAKMWFETKIHLRQSTQVIYETLLRVHILPAFGERPVGKITTLQIQQWIADRHKNSRLNANSVAKAYKVIRNVMDAAVDGGMIARNPCRIKGAGTERLPEMRAATPEEVAAIAAAAEPRWQAFILLAAYSGLRYGELAGLRRKHVDPLHKTVRVEEQLCEVRGAVYFGPPKTQAAVRTVVLPQFIVEVMTEHLALYSEPGRDGMVFLMPEGTVMRRHNFRQRVWLPACQAAGVESLRFHDLRHTSATLAAASGAPLRAVMHRLGHASAAAALRYQHRLEGQDKAVAEFLEVIGRTAAGSHRMVN